MRRALSKDEKKTYRRCVQDCKKAVAGATANFRILGERLKVIKDGELWREDYDTWPDFCQEELPFGDKRADQLVRALATAVANERQARELLGLDPPDQEAVLAIAEAAGELTAPAIRTAREELEAATADLAGDERAATIAGLVEEAERIAAEQKPKGGGRGPRPPKDRKSEVDKLLDRALHFGRLARKSWQGLDDVAEANDQDWYQAVSLIEGIQERSKQSGELDQAA